VTSRLLGYQKDVMDVELMAHYIESQVATEGLTVFACGTAGDNLDRRISIIGNLEC
jgi:hypothetical protein